MKTEQEIREKIKELEEKICEIYRDKESAPVYIRIEISKIEILMLQWVLND